MVLALFYRTLAQLEPEFKSTYKNLSKQVQEFATELLDQTRGSEELDKYKQKEVSIVFSFHQLDNICFSSISINIP